MKLKHLPLLIIAITLLTGCSFLRRNAQPTPTPTPMPTPTPAETPIEPADRPEVTVTALKKTGEYSLTIENLPDDVATVDFELLYMTEGVERGIIGTYYVDDENPDPVYFGTCSSGVCVADENPTDGEIVIEYETEKYDDVILRYQFTP